MTKSRTFDISIRLPEDKKYLKRELLKVAKKNNLTLTQLTISIIELFLEDRKHKQFAIKLK